MMMKEMNMTGMHHMGSMMTMNFYVSTKATLFFKDWVLDNSVGKVVGACIGLIVLGALYEGLKVARIMLQKRRHSQPSTVITNRDVNGTKIEEVVNPRSLPRDGRLLIHWLQTLMHILQVFIGYLLMLAFMTYNVWICIAVLIGSGLGYFIFGWIVSPLDDMGGGGDHCN